jgi:hypothetical protein
MGFWAGTLLAFAAWTFVVPGSASAGCSSHFVPRISSSPESGIGLETLDGAGDMAVADATGLPDRPQPCTGEMCSGRPAMPLSPAPPEARRAGSWAILAGIVLIVAPERVDSPLDEGDARPMHASCSIFHPPRPAPSPSTS